MVEQWSIRLAREVAPDEVELAPELAEAFLAGGTERERLLAPAPATTGGFGTGGVLLLLPLVLAGLASAGQDLLGLLSHSTLGNSISAIKNWLGLRELQQRSRGKAAPETTRLEPLVIQVAETVCRSLERGGVPTERAEATAYRVLLLLMEDPAGASAFVRQLSPPKEGQ